MEQMTEDLRPDHGVRDIGNDGKYERDANSCEAGVSLWLT